MNQGFNPSADAFSLAKLLQNQCHGEGDITFPKATLKIVLDAYVQSWQADQDKKRDALPKVAR